MQLAERLRPEGDQQHHRRRRAAGAAQGEGDGSLAHQAPPAGHRLGLSRRQRRFRAQQRQRIISSIFDGGTGDVGSPNNADTFAFGIVNGNNAFFGFLDALQQNATSPRSSPSRTSWPSAAGRPSSTSAASSRSSCRRAWARRSIEYKQFGTQVDFLPIVLGNGNIRLEVRPRISEIDPTLAASSFNGTYVPALTVRQVDTAVEMKAGQTFALAGLVQERTESQQPRLAVHLRHADHRRAVPQDAGRGQRNRTVDHGHARVRRRDGCLRSAVRRPGLWRPRRRPIASCTAPATSKCPPSAIRRHRPDGLRRVRWPGCVQQRRLRRRWLQHAATAAAMAVAARPTSIISDGVPMQGGTGYDDSYGPTPLPPTGPTELPANAHDRARRSMTLPTPADEPAAAAAGVHGNQSRSESPGSRPGGRRIHRAAALQPASGAGFRAQCRPARIIRPSPATQLRPRPARAA